ncbi:MAG: peptide deformylase [Candidatus Paraimprobicoccus trichonymphae]|uniref:Peptide deformylase n=1 Tax=Candidatus Paraimprobicoccus trichonymphae TaxID=3033793 RepID=A0AA48IAF9_9FIRM|nr:MAG: peptide deformylase [Candidatus Paraimprobicoccus trichonymphae]
MAILEIRLEGDEILTKKSKLVENFDKKLHILLNDMQETMYKSKGIGLAAPQVGKLRRVIIIDIGDGLIEAINPEIVESSGEQKSMEGCLSLPGEMGIVMRPRIIKIKAQNRFGEKIELFGNGMRSNAFSHEIDHLNGVLFKTKVISGNINLFKKKDKSS